MGGTHVGALTCNVVHLLSLRGPRPEVEVNTFQYGCPLRRYSGHAAMSRCPQKGFEVAEEQGGT